MDFTILVKLIMSKFKSAKGYSEFNEDELRKKLTNYLEKKFKKEVGIITMMLDIEEKRNGFQNMERYTEEYGKIEIKMISKAKEIAAVNKEDLKNFV